MRTGNFWRDQMGLVWLFLAVVVAAAHQWIPDASWIMVHLVLLGALSHAILVWSRHFSLALLRARPSEVEQTRHTRRLQLHTLGAAGVVLGVPLATWHVTVVFALLLGGVTVWHGVELWRLARGALPGRFRVTVWYYWAAAAMFPVGATFGVLLATGPGMVWFPRLLTAHVVAMVLGWVALTVTGTLLTFWPTMLRARMDERAESFTRQALLWLLAGLVLIEAATLLGDSVSVLVGMSVYGFGLLWYGRGLFAPLKVRRPREFAPASVGLALVWFLVGYVWLGSLLARDGWVAVDGSLGRLLAVIVVGFAAQLLTGALSYLIPSVIGGGPAVVRAGQKEVNRLATVRLVLINGGLLIWLLPTPGWVRVVISSVVLGALATFLMLATRGALAGMRAKRDKRDGVVATITAEQGVGSAFTRRGLLAGIGVLLGGSAAGVAVDPPAVGLPNWPQRTPPVEPTGRTTAIRVIARDMRFHPGSVEVARGDMLRVTIANVDEVDSHDLRIGDVQTPLIHPGSEGVLEYGPVAQDIEGYCTVVGHRAAGMTFNVTVSD